MEKNKHFHFSTKLRKSANQGRRITEISQCTKRVLDERGRVNDLFLPCPIRQLASSGHICARIAGDYVLSFQVWLDLFAICFCLDYTTSKEGAKSKSKFILIGIFTQTTGRERTGNRKRSWSSKESFELPPFSSFRL